MRTRIELDTYSHALATAQDEGYRAHLLNDFIVKDDGAYPKIDIVRSSDRDNTYTLFARWQ